MVFCWKLTGERTKSSFLNSIAAMRFIKFLVPIAAAGCSFVLMPKEWSSKFVQIGADGSLKYTPDEKGNIIPDFSRVGYYAGDKQIPDVPVVKTISPAANGSSEELIEAAVAEVAKRTPDANGFKGAILLQKGTYIIPESVNINASGVVLRGEGDNANGTKIVATSKKQVAAFDVAGKGKITEVQGTRVKITDNYVPVGATSFNVSNAANFKAGDKVILFRPGTQDWIHDLQMDKIEERDGTKQWQAKEYDLQFERVVTKTEGNKIFIDNPVMMAMEPKYGGGEVYRYTYDGRISHVGVENIYFESEFESDTAENHAWDAVKYDNIENGWIRNVTAKYFGYSCVNLDNGAKNISVLNSNCFDHKSIITGGRRYSFNNTGQLNLFADCHATDGRHDFVTGARVLGPNVFVNCTAKKTHADIGPHHRWSVGTLYDNIVTDGEINIQDRGNWGSGHGWSGVTQIMWNCTVKRAAVQSPWANGKNYSIGTKGGKYDGRFKGRPDGEWEGQNEKDLNPKSLYYAQLNARRKK
jgi:hypothetical protein